MNDRFKYWCNRKNLERFLREKCCVDYKTGYYRLNDTNEFAHRAIIEDIEGRKLKSNEKVHHMNGNKLDNHPTNLEVLDYEDHFEIHVKQKFLSKVW